MSELNSCPADESAVPADPSGLRGYRKLLACGLALGIATALVSVGTLTGSEWVTASLGSVGLYVGGNAATRFAGRGRS